MILDFLFTYFDYPLVLLAPPLIIILLFFTTFKDFVQIKKETPEEHAKRRHLKLFVLVTRILIFTLLLIALAAPFKEVTKEIQGTPRIKLLIDNSTSMTLFSQTLPEKLKTQLEDQIPVEVAYLGKEESSPLGDGILSAVRKDDNILLLTDGHANEGTILGDAALYAASINVTLNAINQTLPQILDRISKQVDMRYELKDGLLVVMPDSPFLKSYKIDYVNMSRDAEGGISNTSQIGSGALGGATSGGANNSQLSIKNSSKNHFWDTLVKNITDFLRETDKVLPQGSSVVVVQQQKTESKKGDAATADQDNAAIVEGEGSTVTRRSTFREAASVISNPEAGILTVRATSKQHEKIQEFVTQVMRSARRQVLIEATIAEVRLNSNYQQGIN